MILWLVSFLAHSTLWLGAAWLGLRLAPALHPWPANSRRRRRSPELHRRALPIPGTPTAPSVPGPPNMSGMSIVPSTPPGTSATTRIRVAVMAEPQLGWATSSLPNKEKNMRTTSVGWFRFGAVIAMAWYAVASYG